MFSFFLVVLLEMSESICSTRKHSLLVSFLLSLNEFLSSFLEYVPDNFVFLDLFTLLLVFFLDELYESFELSLAVVSTLTCCHVWKALHFIEISLALIQHLTEDETNCWWAFASDEHFVKVYWWFLLKNDSDWRVRLSNHTHLSSCFDIDLPHTEALSKDNFLDEKSFLCKTLSDTISFGAIKSLSDDLTSLFVNVLDKSKSIIDVLLSYNSGSIIKLIDTVWNVKASCDTRGINWFLKSVGERTFRWWSLRQLCFKGL